VPIHSTAEVLTDKVGRNVNIRNNVVIAEGVTIGDNVTIHPNVVIEEGVVIGDNVEIFTGAYLGKIPKGAGALSREPRFKKSITIGDNCSIGPHAVIYYDVSIGENTLIGDAASIREQCKIGDFCIISRHVTINYNSTIGNRTKIMDASHITGNCQIGDDVFISLHVGMANDNLIGLEGYVEDKIKGPTIHNKVAIGLGAMLMPGVIIGEGAIVAGQSVVNKDVEAWTLVAGFPARKVKNIQPI
jgi:UDP-3-O-[3-hydroxymyristoyl] glucosamine N-acyltransferase